MPASPPAPATATAHHRGIAALLAALASVGPFSIDAYLPSMPEIGHVLHADPLAVQQTLTAYMIPFAVMTLWHGAISDAVGRRPVILWGTALFAAASAACAFSTSIGMLLVFRGLQGVTAGAGVVVGRAIVRDRFHGAEAQRVMSQITLTFALAPAIAPVLGGWLQVAFGWRAVFIFLVLFAGSSWLMCRFLLTESLPLERRQPFNGRYLAATYSKVLTSVRFVALSLASTLTFCGFFIYVTSAPVFLMQHLGVPATGFLWLFGPATLGMALGSWLSGRVAGRFSPRKTIFVAFGIMTTGVVANLLFHFLHRPQLPWSVVPLFIYVLGMSLSFPTVTLLALDLFPEQRGLVASCLSFVQMAGASVASMLVPLIWGSVRSLSATSALAVAGAIIALLVARVPRHLQVPTPTPAT